MKQKNRKEDFLERMLLVTLGASFIGNLINSKGTIKASEGTISFSKF